MAEKPILFSTPMVQAIMRGEKSMTRRVLKVPPEGSTLANVDADSAVFVQTMRVFNGAPVVEACYVRKLPYAVGDRLWAKETWRARRRWDDTAPRDIPQGEPIHHQADKEGDWNPQDWGRWRPSLFMPKWAARIWLEVTAVRVERLQEISEDDCYAEGYVFEPIGEQPEPAADWWFRELWQSINGKKHPWESNPWVGVYEFKEVSNA